MIWCTYGCNRLPMESGAAPAMVSTVMVVRRARMYLILIQDCPHRSLLLKGYDEC